MITLITGLGGAGKTLYTVSELLFKQQNEYIEFEGQRVKRRIFSNINGLVLDHERIDKNDLEKWHEWVKPGDLICFDEVQEVWRTRSMSVIPPPAVQALEVHRSKYSIDLILITQHPMLVDQNIRRLVNRHLHVRRIANLPFAWVYEWDHASNPSSTKSAVTSGKWFYPKHAYKLYLSAQVHTKQTRKLPAALFIMFGGIAVLFFLFFPQYLPSPVSGLFGYKKPADTGIVTTVTAVAGDVTGQLSKVKSLVAPVTSSPGVTSELSLQTTLPVYPLTDLKALPDLFKPYGCVRMVMQCKCYGQAAEVIPVDLKQCFLATTQIALIARSSTVLPSVPPVQKSVVASVEKSDKAEPSKEFQDSGFALPVGSPYQQHATRYKGEPSGNLYPH